MLSTAIDVVGECVCDHGTEYECEQWQTLKATVLAQQTNNKQSMPLSKDKPVPREGMTLNEGLWPNKRP